MHFMPEYNESILEFYSYVKHKKIENILIRN